MNENSTLSPPQLAAIQALLSEPTIGAAATKAGIGETTVYRYMKDPGFKAELRKAQNEVIGVAVARLSGAAIQAVDTLVALLSSASDGVKVQAAAVLLAQLRGMIDQYDLGQRLDELEARLGVGGDR